MSQKPNKEQKMILVLLSLWKLQVLGVLCQKPEVEMNTDILAYL